MAAWCGGRRVRGWRVVLRGGGAQGVLEEAEPGRPGAPMWLLPVLQGGAAVGRWVGVWG